MSKVYNEFKAEKFLSRFVSVAKSQLVKDFKDLKLKPPLVLKIISDDALHKTEFNGVKVVKIQAEVEPTFKELVKTASRRRLKLDGILAQKYLEGEELIIGVKKDPVFNHVLMFGLGGVYAESLKDISIRKCPINFRDAQEMIDDLKAKNVIYGVRGKKLNINALKRTMVEVSKIPLKNKSIIELDINPFILNEFTGLVADARIIF